MQHPDLTAAVEEGLRSVPMLDVHTHLDASHLSARGLHDVLLYHMLISELGSAGCPTLTRLAENPDDAEAHTRIVEALPYLRSIRNTGLYWVLSTILRDLFGWTEPITRDNWRRLDGIVRERAADPA